MPPLVGQTHSTSNALSILRQLEWRVRHAVETVLSGEYRSTFRGRGMEFDQVVRYEFGDDVRDIDWNVTARLGEAYRKKFVEEREVTVMLVLEDTPTLQFGSGNESKREALLELAGLIMLLGAVNRDRVGFVHVTPEGHFLSQPVRGRGPILHAAATLLSRPAPSVDFNDNYKVPELPWKFLSKVAPKHSILVWLGDFPPRQVPEGWAFIQKRYQTMGFRVDDIWERNLPKQDAFAAYDPSSGQLVTLEGSAAEREAQQQWLIKREDQWKKLFPNPLSRLVALTDQDRLETLVRFFQARMRTGSR